MKDNTFKQISSFVAAIIVLSVIGTISCSSSLEMHVWQGARAYGDDNFDKTIAEFTEAIEIDPDNAAFYSWRGSAYYKKAQYDLAIDDFTVAIDLNPEFSASDFNMRGLSYYAKDEYDLAIQDFTEAIKKDHHPYSYNGRGLAYHKEEKYDLAIHDFTTAIKVGSHYIEPYSNRADTYIATGQIALAKADLFKVIELSDDPALAQSAQERLNNLSTTD